MVSGVQAFGCMFMFLFWKDWMLEYPLNIHLADLTSFERKS